MTMEEIAEKLNIKKEAFPPLRLSHIQVPALLLFDCKLRCVAVFRTKHELYCFRQDIRIAVRNTFERPIGWI